MRPEIWLSLLLVVWECPTPVINLHQFNTTWVSLETETPMYWALTPHLPIFQLMTWNHEASPLFLFGNASWLTGDLGLAVPIISKTGMNVTWTSAALPLCLSPSNISNSSISQLCYPLSNWSISQPSFLESELLNATYGSLNITLASLIRNFSNNHTVTTSLPPCPLTAPHIFEPLHACSTGNFSRLNNTNESIWFADNYPQTSILPAPIPFKEKAPLQSHWWKAGLALHPTFVRYNQTAAKVQHGFPFATWHKIFGNKNSTCHETNATTTTDILCYTFTAEAQTTPDALFLLCPPGNFTISIVPQANNKTGYTIHCTNATLTNTLNTSHTSFIVLLLRVPPFTLHPVRADPFALSLSDSLLCKLVKRDIDPTDIVAVAALALSIIEETQIMQLHKQVTFLAEFLQHFMHLESQAWKHQETLDRLLERQITTLSATVQVLLHQQAFMLRYMRLSCHYKYRPVCVTPIPYNSTMYNDLEDILRNATTGVVFATELQQLDLIIMAIENATLHFSQDWEDSISKTVKWWDDFQYQNVLQWILHGALVLVGGFLLCVFLPCLISCFLSLLKRSLAALKAEFRNANSTHPL
ncbi:uncharacterized protein LOC110206253 [Phascolarctos cinereus]|uniref:Uncharacterized protein LOC110206253 n=1 Tax=Phascolarctos cinereus TaxID=38626 RepID=A0A6P5K223_PHACI|nr:uncharacterized protein LOC110206253 [Phascolarctos cinereus]XP_020839156.1 uncharacterized protein LOC110206253 [Phascolarctos cinereus]XP_020839158.1 uncharacterized protein LOC110206253 [Phascolarctos cinereus]XP_020839159.1 uncharacterized protein LOC110206253 [Phascolarctos cinereus]XP_020839160.1 uncharacterized protein LOC110206253 [Phascolarctos cinereus]XP_020839161.1 uncharacterized protein LOC110206253 [Phascolarctos cinereus]